MQLKPTLQYFFKTFSLIMNNGINFHSFLGLKPFKQCHQIVDSFKYFEWNI